MQVFLHNTTTTPSQPGYGQLVRAALAGVQAEACEDSAYRLADGSELLLFTEVEDDISLVEYPRLTSAVADAIFEIARRTGSLIFVPGSCALRIAGNPGEPPAMFAIAIEAVGMGQVADAEDLESMLAGLEADQQVAAPAVIAHHRSGLGRRIVDFLFGRPG